MSWKAIRCGDEEGLAAFRAELPFDNDTWRQARGWARRKALTTAAGVADDHSSMENARKTVAEVNTDHRQSTGTWRSQWAGLGPDAFVPRRSDFRRIRQLITRTDRYNYSADSVRHCLLITSLTLRGSCSTFPVVPAVKRPVRESTLPRCLASALTIRFKAGMRPTNLPWLTAS